MKAYEVTVPGFDHQSFYAAPKRSKAIELCYSAVTEAGYIGVKWTELRAKRVPELDELAQFGLALKDKENQKPRSIGFIDNGVWHGEIRTMRAMADGCDPSWY